MGAHNSTRKDKQKDKGKDKAKNKVKPRNIKNLKNEFENVRSKYILQKILEILPKKRTLAIVKYNKKLQEKLNLNINDYKEYSESFSSIEIEIIPANNSYGKFININYYSDKYHIYFNNNRKEEIKRNQLNWNENVSKINIIIDYAVKSLDELFYNCYNVKSINFKRFYRNNIENMSRMFYNCTSLQEINLLNCNTINVTDMSNMFYNCSSLKQLDLSDFNTRNVTNMRSMFANCSLLEKINISNFNTSKVTNMRTMFAYCSSLKELNLSNFDTYNVSNMVWMFNGCSDKLIKKIRNKNKNKIIKEEAFD